MRIRTERITGILLFSFGLYLAVKLRPFLADLFETVNQEGNDSDPIKALMLGVVCLTFLAAIKLLINRK